MRLTQKQRLERIKNLKGITKADKKFLDDLCSIYEEYVELKEEKIKQSLEEYYNPKQPKDWY